MKQRIQLSGPESADFFGNIGKLKQEASLVGSLLFDNEIGRILAGHTHISIECSDHIRIPWEILVIGNKFLSMDRIFYRKQIWSLPASPVPVWRRKTRARLIVLDALQHESSRAEWELIRNCAALSGKVDAVYHHLLSQEQVYEAFGKYDMVHFIAHGEITKGRLAVITRNGPAHISTRHILPPYPRVLVLHICFPFHEAPALGTSFPAHHTLIPDTLIREGHQVAFMQGFYLNMFDNLPIGVAVKLARKAAYATCEDPFAFVYYGNGSFRLFPE